MATCFGLLKEPDNIYVYSKKKIPHFDSNCCGRVGTDNKCEFRFVVEKNAWYWSLVNKTAGSVN